MKYVCELCGFIYDENMGDLKNNIPAGTLFSDLPVDYTCPVCGAEKEGFTQLESGTAVKPDNQAKFHSQR